MQFVPKGPDIPDSLVQAHEDGRVVFFCGAGISYPAGLPGFAGLVQGLYTDLGMTPNEVQAEALRKNQYDTAIALIETEYSSISLNRINSAAQSPAHGGASAHDFRGYTVGAWGAPL